MASSGPGLLLVGQQVGSGVQRSPGPIERIVLSAAVAAGRELDPASAAVQRIAGQANDVDRIHHGDCIGQLFGGGGLEAGEAVHRDHLDAVPKRGVLCVEPGLEACLDRPSIMSNSREGLCRRGLR